MAKFSKLWGMIGGSLIGMIFSALAVYGVANCTDVNDVSTCTVIGLGASQITAVLTTIFGALGTFLAPKNAP